MVQPREAQPAGRLAFDVLRGLVARVRDPRMRLAWLAFVVELDRDGLLEGLDELDAVWVVLTLFGDLGGNADGSHLLRWRAELLEAGPDAGEGLADPAAVAAVLRTIGQRAGTAAREGAGW